MSAAPMTFPGSRVFQGWWRDLAALAPRRLWFAHLLLHRVEALVEVAGRRPLDTLGAALLATLAREPASAEQLAGTLVLERPLLAELLGGLEAAGLADRGEGGQWQATARGRAATAPATEGRRQAFYFADGVEPAFVPLAGPTTPLMPPAGWAFDLARLEACVAATPAWKATHGFPADVVRLLRHSEDDWRSVALDRAEQALLVLLERDGELLGLPVQADAWALARQPVLTMNAAAMWFEPGGADVWRQAWQAWCQQRSLPAAEVEACQVEPDGPRLRVRAPARLVERLRGQRSDAVKGEAWLLAGADRVRGVARVELEQG